jgi:hypothetical protein
MGSLRRGSSTASALAARSGASALLRRHALGRRNLTATRPTPRCRSPAAPGVLPAPGASSVLAGLTNSRHLALFVPRRRPIDPEIFTPAAQFQGGEQAKKVEIRSEVLYPARGPGSGHHRRVRGVKRAAFDPASSYHTCSRRRRRQVHRLANKSCSCAAAQRGRRPRGLIEQWLPLPARIRSVSKSGMAPGPSVQETAI